MSSASISLAGLDEWHPCITPALAEVMFEAARVCLDRHHAPPIDLETRTDNHWDTVHLDWPPSDNRLRRAWGNQIEAIEWGAVGVALAYAGQIAGLLAVRRAQRGSGADYFMIREDADLHDLEARIRLEISGVERGNLADLNRRLAQKVEQLGRGRPAGLGVAVVVGFSARTLCIARMNAS